LGIAPVEAYLIAPLTRSDF